MRRSIRHCRHGFTLIELLTVLAIIAILLVSVGSFSTSSSIKVLTTGQMVRDNLNLARATAIARNRMVEVLFYKLPSANSGTLQYRGMQLLILDSTGSNPSPLTKVISFPSTFILESATQSYASLLFGTNAALSGTINLPVYGPTSFEGFTYKPDGSTNLSVSGPNGDTWFVMVHSEQDITLPPKNYYLVQVDPINGRTSTFRP